MGLEATVGEWFRIDKSSTVIVNIDGKLNR